MLWGGTVGHQRRGRHLGARRATKEGCNQLRSQVLRGAPRGEMSGWPNIGRHGERLRWGGNLGNYQWRRLYCCDSARGALFDVFQRRRLRRFAKSTYLLSVQVECFRGAPPSEADVVVEGLNGTPNKGNYEEREAVGASETLDSKRLTLS